MRTRREEGEGEEGGVEVKKGGRGKKKRKK